MLELKYAYRIASLFTATEVATSNTAGVVKRPATGGRTAFTEHFFRSEPQSYGNGPRLPLELPLPMRIMIVAKSISGKNLVWENQETKRREQASYHGGGMHISTQASAYPNAER